MFNYVIFISLRQETKLSNDTKAVTELGFVINRAYKCFESEESALNTPGNLYYRQF